MELRENDNLFQVMLTDGTELFIVDQAKDTPAILSLMSEGITKSDFIELHRIDNKEANKETQPTFYRKLSVLSIKKVNEGILGNVNKVWRLG